MNVITIILDKEETIIPLKQQEVNLSKSSINLRCKYMEWYPKRN